MNVANPRRIHITLVVRISATAFIISFLFGFAAWQYGKKDIRQEILSGAKNGFKMLNNRIRDLFDSPKESRTSAIQHELDRIMGERRKLQLGQVIWVGIYDLRRILFCRNSRNSGHPPEKSI